MLQCMANCIIHRGTHKQHTHTLLRNEHTPPAQIPDSRSTRNHSTISPGTSMPSAARLRPCDPILCTHHKSAPAKRFSVSPRDHRELFIDFHRRTAPQSTAVHWRANRDTTDIHKQSKNARTHNMSWHIRPPYFSSSSSSNSNISIQPPRYHPLPIFDTSPWRLVANNRTFSHDLRTHARHIWSESGKHEMEFSRATRQRPPCRACPTALADNALDARDTCICTPDRVVTRS